MKTPMNEILKTEAKKPAIDLATIINDMIDVHKLKKNKLKLFPKETDFRKFLQEFEKNANITINIDEIPEILYIDTRRLKQILLNIISPSTEIYVTSTLLINTDDNITRYKIDFLLNNRADMSAERIFITKKIIALFNGSIIFDDDVKFNIKAYKDSDGFSTIVMKKITGKKIHVKDDNAQELCEKLINWGLIIEDKPTDADLVIINLTYFNQMIDKLSVPYILIVNNDDKHNDDITPVNTPRDRSRTVRNNIIRLGTSDSDILSLIVHELC